eukprot:TRINITY_DN32785_c0_g2_i7.p1 TRINITY_DN32785_c0_g2~~TRINITY_DN32785_c0_g2_i7.p1  ORF type:complete len:211 (-),score=34.02 TRINITY_DN32785_c0_g2_i7:442-1053(-)
MTTNQQSTNNVEQISVSKARSSSMPSINSVFAKIKTRHSSQKAITQKVPVPTQTQPISISPDLIEKKLQEEIDQVQASFVELENVQFGEEEGVGVNSEDGKVVAQIKPKKQTTMEVMKRITSFGAILNKKQAESSQQETQDQQEETQELVKETEEAAAKTNKRGNVSLKSAFGGCCSSSKLKEVAQLSANLEENTKQIANNFQ